MLLESGDKVPADLRLADAKNLRTEEAALTGESVPAEKTTDPVAEKSTVGDRDSMVFPGPWSCRAARPGWWSPPGARLSSAASTSCSPASARFETPLLRQIKKLGYLITAAVGVVGFWCSPTAAG